MVKMVSYAGFALAFVVYLMLAPTVGHMILFEGDATYAWLLALIPGVMFYVARAGYESAH
jgi:hypothetical protein